MLKGYEEYKDTGYDWIPLVPKTWKQRTIRSITSLSNERNGKRKDLELLSVYREFGVIKKSSRDDNHNVESQDLSNYKYVNSCYLVMNKMKMWQGSLGISQHEGIVSPAYIVCKVDQNIIGKYLHYLLRSSQFKTFYNRISYGVRVGQWDLRYNDLKNLKIYLPTSDEQNQIVRYLDAKVAKINRLISAKKKEIALLKEYKQAIITRAVTKGLNTKTNTKPSGFLLLSDVPEDWNILYLFQIADEQKISNKTVHNQNLLSLSYGKIKNKDINSNEGLLPASFDTYQIVHDGNTILRLTDLQNDWNSLRVGLATQTGIITSAYIVLQPKKGILPPYLYFLLHSYDLKKVFYGLEGGVRQSANYSQIKRLPILVPPISEQKLIIDRCRNTENQINNLIDAIDKIISSITEYKTRLISDVVTGKVDVRGIHVEDVPEVELIDEFDEEIVDEFDDETSEEENIE